MKFDIKLYFLSSQETLLLTYGGYPILVINIIAQQYSYSRDFTCRNISIERKHFKIVLFYGCVQSCWAIT